MPDEDWDDDAPEEGESENEGEESFAELLEAYGAGLTDSLELGDKVTVKIISISSDTIFVDTGTKIDGVVEKTDLCDDDGSLAYREGDSLELFVVAVGESEIRLSRALSGIGGMAMLQDAFSDRIPVEGKVVETCKGGFRVEVFNKRAFCPISQMDVKYVESPDIYVGQTFPFLIARLEEGGRNIVLSRRQLLKQAQEKASAEFLAGVHGGDVVAGTVTRLMPYGAFVELVPGLEGMAHISELSWSRVESPEAVVRPGDAVTVRILDIQPSTGKGEAKISLSLKQVQADPWETVSARFKAGDKVKGRVTRCMDFGAFVEIAPGIEGLVHVSEMSYVRRVAKAEDVVSPGETVAVVVKEVQPDKRRISLSMRDTEGDPWVDVSEKYTAGRRVDGVVQRHESFGIFVALEPGVTGLLHKSKINRSAKAADIQRLKPGDRIPVVIEGITPAERKISLDVGDAAEEGDWKSYANSGGGALGSLGEQLQQALDRQRPKK